MNIIKFKAYSPNVAYCGERWRRQAEGERGRKRERGVRDLGLDKGQQKQDRAYINMNASDNDRDGRIILTPHTETYRQRKIKQ